MDKNAPEKESNALPNPDLQETPAPDANVLETENIPSFEFTEAQLEAASKAARELFNKANFDEGCIVLEEALKSAEKAHGESSYESARLHFEIGSALLQKVESSRDVFGDAIKAGKPAQESKEEEGPEDIKEEAKEAPTAQQQPDAPKKNTEEVQEITTSKEDVDKRDRVEIVEEESRDTMETTAIEQPAEAEEEVDDLQAAWEQMEVARVFLEKLVSPYDPSDPNIDEDKMAKYNKISRALAHVMLRLGDANCYREDFEAAIQDYDKSLKIRKTIEDTFFSRDLAEIYYLLGNAHLYKNYDTCDDVALGYFNRARIILENLLYKFMGSSSVKDPEDVQTHTAFMSREYLKPSIFETEKSKEIKEILVELYNKIDDTKEQKKERAKVNEELQKARHQAQENEKLESTFSKPVIGTEKPDDPTNKPAPKVIHLGTLGSAASRKRNRDEMEAQKTSITFNGINSTKSPQEASSNQNQEKKTTERDESKGGQETVSLSGKPTKVDEEGHVEKMSKI